MGGVSEVIFLDNGIPLPPWGGSAGWLLIPLGFGVDNRGYLPGYPNQYWRLHQLIPGEL